MKSKRKNIKLKKRNNNSYNRSKNIGKYEWLKYFISFILGVSTTLLGSFSNYKIQQKINQISLVLNKDYIYLSYAKYLYSNCRKNLYYYKKT